MRASSSPSPSRIRYQAARRGSIGGDGDDSFALSGGRRFPMARRSMWSYATSVTA
jgi:hypothetical protein